MTLPNDTAISIGLCQCGCGRATNLAPQTCRRSGWIKGEPMRFVLGHANAGRYRVDEDSFWARVAKGDGDACWEWLGLRDDRGYGRLHWHGRMQLAHRVAYALVNGPISDDIEACHNCPDGDNPGCVRPDHMFLGTQADNTADAVAKGMMLRGEECPWSILTNDDVLFIRRVYVPRHPVHGATALAQRFGVSISTIGKVIHGESWMHLIDR